MSATWPQVSLGELLRLERRPVSVIADNEYTEIGIYCFGRGIFHKMPRSGLEVGNKDLFLIKEGDFILQVTFAWEGAVALASKAEDGMFGSTRFPTFRVDESRCYAPYLGCYFKTPGGREQLVKISPGSAGRNRVLSLKRIPEVFVPLPPLAEQRRIVARIEELSAQAEEALGLRRKAVEEAEAFITSLHAKLSGSRIKKLGDILRLEEDSVKIKPTESYPQVGIRGFGGGLFAKPATSGTDTTYRAFNRLYDGALVMSQVKAWEGAVAVCGKNLAGYFVSPEYRTFRFDPAEAIPSYFAAIVKTEWFWSRLKDATRGVGARRERTRPEHFLNIEIPLPEVVQQKEAAIVIEKINALKHLQVETAAQLSAIIPSILDKAFKGKLI